ncbi:MAG: hypothetical protein GX351_08260 [Peptococcaceae bacterium]|jgi:hypothetical protein|nr:hypothetical protein [Peptococcaceae bacterium]
MARKKLLGLIFLCFLFLCGCTSSFGNSAGQINPPVIESCPLEGKWEMLRELGSYSSHGGTSEQETSNQAQFTTEAVFYSGIVWDQPSYKSKLVDMAEYLLTKYISLPADFTPQSQEVEVVTVHTAANYLGEFMKIDETRMISFVQDKAFLWQKVALQADEFLTAVGEEKTGLKEELKEEAVGVLLGLKIPEDDGYSYRTLLVAAEHRQLQALLKSKDIFFPRSSGFWELKVLEEGPLVRKISPILLAQDVATQTLRGQGEERPFKGMLSSASSLENDKEASQASPQALIKSIDFISNDYLSLEIETIGRKELRIIPVDKISLSAGIKAGDLLGEKGSEIYRNTREEIVSELRRQQEITWIVEDRDEKNFGLRRKNGHWYLIGRVNYQKENSLSLRDFQLNIIPPANLVVYDTLTLSWQQIKDRVPGALDAFTSPNKDLALIKTKNKLYIYLIVGEGLAGKPLAELELAEGTDIIMAEWATGSYVASWQRAFLAYGAEAF